MPAIRKPADYDLFVLSEEHILRLRDRYGIQGEVSTTDTLVSADRVQDFRTVSRTSYKRVLNSPSGSLFLKRIPWYASSETQLRFSTGLQTYLTNNGSCVPALVRTADGSWWSELDGNIFTLAKYEVGFRQRGLSSEIRAAGVALAHMHRCSIGYGAPALRETPYSLASDHLLIATEDLQDSNSTAAAANVLNGLQSLLHFSRLHGEKAEIGLLNVQPIHGDYSGENLLFSSDAARVLAVVDFDNCDMDIRMHDIVEGLMSRAWIQYRSGSTDFVRLGTDVDIKKGREFLTGYHSVSNISKDEWRCFAGVLASFVVETISLGLIRGDVSPEAILSTINFFGNSSNLDALSLALVSDLIPQVT